MAGFTDLFDDSLGQFEGWSTTAAYEADRAFIDDNAHVDLRCFLQDDLYRGRTQFEMDQLDQTYLDTLTQDEIDNVTRISGENWTKTGTGFTNLNVGAISARQNWRGLTMDTTGAALNTTLESLISHDTNIDATAPLDLTTGVEYLSIVFPDIPAPGDLTYFDDSTSYVQLTSDDGAGGHDDSAQVLFSARYAISYVISANHTVGANELVLDLADFDTVGFDRTKVTGIRIHLDTNGSAVTASEEVTIMAVRAIHSTWKYTEIDYNTRFKALVSAVSLDGQDPVSGDEFIQLIRGVDDSTDLKPADVQLSAFFNVGSQTATGTDYNSIDMLFREVKGTTTGDVVVARLSWNDTDTKFHVYKEDYVSPTITPSDIVASYVLPSVVLEASDVTDDDLGKYFFQIQVSGQELTLNLYKCDANLFLESTPVYQTTLFDSSTQFNYQTGRVGMFASFYDRDAYVEDFIGAAIGYAEYISKPFYSRTPVDGAQLEAVFSPDQNMFTDFNWLVLSEKISEDGRDLGKGLSDLGAFRTNHGVYSNQFLIEDFRHAYVEMDIFVSSRVTTINQPNVYLFSTTTGALQLNTNDFKPNNWNHVSVDLSELYGNLTGIFYTLFIQPNINDTRLGNFWIDNVKINKRTVAWQFRADAANPYRNFYGMVNNGDGAIHLGKSERGTAAQIRAVALTDDAWISSHGFKLSPHYSELGNPLYDRYFDTQ